MTDDGRICQRCGTRYHKGIAHEKRCEAETTDELEIAHREAMREERTWSAREGVVFYVAMSTALLYLASDLRWLGGVSALALIAWVMLFFRHLRARREEQRAWGLWLDSFYSRGRT